MVYCHSIIQYCLRRDAPRYRAGGQAHGRSGRGGHGAHGDRASRRGPRDSSSFLTPCRMEIKKPQFIIKKKENKNTWRHPSTPYRRSSRPPPVAVLCELRRLAPAPAAASDASFALTSLTYCWFARRPR